MAGFLVIVGLTGSVLAFREELDAWLNPELLTVARRDAPMLDPLALREIVTRAYSGARIDEAPLHVEEAKAFQLRVWPNSGPFEGRLVFVYLDPYTGKTLGRRLWGDVSLDRKDIIPFLYRLHYTLALPASSGKAGVYTLGIVALIWTIDCFVSVYLTFPLNLFSGKAARKSWWGRWKPAWLIKLSGGFYRMNFDVHRAAGLWTWAMLFVLAWSGVGFNLNEVYAPTMRMLFGLSQPAIEPLARQEPHSSARLDWRAARDRGRVLLEEQARRHGFEVGRDELLTFDRDRDSYTFFARSSRDIGRSAQTLVVFDASTGVLREAKWPGDPSERVGDMISRWLRFLHTAGVFGLPLKFLVCAMGFVASTLSVTGVYIWWKKRAARLHNRRTSSRRVPALTLSSS